MVQIYIVSCCAGKPDVSRATLNKHAHNVASSVNKRPLFFAANIKSVSSSMLPGAATTPLSLMPPLDPTVEMPTTIGFVGPQPQVKEANWIKLQATALGDAMDAVIWLTTLEWQLAYSMLYKVQLRCGDLHSFKGFFRYLHLENHKLAKKNGKPYISLMCNECQELCHRADGAWHTCI